MLAKLNELKHLGAREFDAEVGKALKAIAVERLAKFPAMKPKKAAPKKKAAAKKPAKK